jgi:hypothetical protein
MKSFFKSFFEFCEAFGTARAAAYLARHGRITEAKALYEPSK